MIHSILVIGGEATLRSKLASVLHEASFVVATAPDYHGMLFNHNGFEPDLVIMDEVPLDGDTVEVCYQLRNSFGIPVILLGRDSSKEAWRRVTEAEIDSYVLKPVTYRELVARVKAVLRRYEAQQIPDLQSRLKLFRSDAGSTQEEEK